MKKIFKLLPLFVLLMSCGTTRNEVSEEEFDKFALEVKDTSNYTQITAHSSVIISGYEYKARDNTVVENKDKEESDYVIKKENGEWVTDEDSKYVLEYAQRNYLSNYKKEVITDREDGEWHFYLDLPSIYIEYEEDQKDGEIKAHIAQTFAYDWDSFGRLISNKITAKKIWYLNGAVEGYGSTITADYIQLVTFSYQ